VCLTEYDEEFVMNALREEYREAGFEQGLAEGRIEGCIEFARKNGISDNNIILQLMEMFQISEEKAIGYLNNFDNMDSKES